MRVGSLFSGAGCGDLGLEWAGFEHAWFCEVAPYARKILALRWPGKPIYEDIREVDFTKVEPVDMLAGGFPCQDISNANPNAQGIKGKRSGLWSEFARAIAEIRPRYAFVENSQALVKRGLSVVLSDLAALGYDAEWHCVTASSIGAPHRRDRIWIVANASSGRCREPEGREVQQPGGTEIISAGQDVAHPQSIGRRTGENESEHAWDHKGGGRLVETYPGRQAAPVMRHDLARPSEGGRRWWAVEPGLGRVAHGVAHRMDRLHCIGNGQVPHCAYMFGTMIQEHARATGYTHSK